MKRNYLAVFEKVADDNWGAFAPDVPGTGGMGDSIEEARQSLLEGIGYMLEDIADRGLQMPEAKSTAVDFSEFDPEHTDLQYVVEWLPVDLPQFVLQTHDNAQQAA
jgi:predicted RNase H-like HicB family nuclease